MPLACVEMNCQKGVFTARKAGVVVRGAGVCGGRQGTDAWAAWSIGSVSRKSEGMS